MLIRRHTTRRAAPDSAGFTLIELLISMVIVMVLLTAFTSFLVRSFASSQKANDESSAIGQVNKAVTQFSSDIQKAKSPDREETQLGDPGLLSDALLNGVPLKNVVNNQTITLDVADIIEATSNSFTFRADVLAQAGVECVRYYVTAGAKPALWRQISAYKATTGCSAVSLVNDQLIQQVR